MADNPAEPVVVTACAPAELSRIAEVHRIAFPGFFMTQMGPGFVRQYYSTILDYPSGILLVARINEQVIGFAAGFHRPSSFYEFYRSRRAFLLSDILIAAISSPRLIPRILANVLRVTTSTADNRDTELASIGVLPHMQGRGVGKNLLAEFTERARDLGSRSIVLTTNTLENDRTNRIYLRYGFLLEEAFTRSGRKMNRFRLPL